MTLEIRMFKKKEMVLNHLEPFHPDADEIKELVVALETLSSHNVISGYHLVLDAYSPHFED